MRFQYNDGGRRAAGFKGEAPGDCVCRAIAIATGLPYREVYDSLRELAKCERRPTRGYNSRSNPRTGVYRRTYETWLAAHGWVWKACMRLGTGCRVHMRRAELPPGTIIVRLSKHIACVKDGVLHDLTGEVARDGTRCVYGYWYKPQA